jgi:hypothetical protein
MMASLHRELPRDDDRYGWEFKWDGVRAIGYVTGDSIRFLSRPGHEITGSYPELAVLADRVPGPVIVDGEIIALGRGRPDFGLLRSRMHARHPPDRLVQAVPVQLYLFDLLYQGIESLLEAPYAQRRARLEDLGLTSTRSGHRRGTAAARETSRPSASPTAWKASSASRWPPPTIRGSAGTGSRSRTSGTSRSSSAAGNPAKAAGRTPSAPCWLASTTPAVSATPDTSAPGSPRPCSPT